MSKATSHREIEFKFRIPEGTELSTAQDLRHLLDALDLDVRAPESRSMVATYFDTPNLSLLRWGITLRNRRGGGDDGWHLKVPAAPSGTAPARDEIRIDKDTADIPHELIAMVSPLLRRQELHPMATVRTLRQPFVITSHDGTPLIEAVDDRVDVESQVTGGSGSSFHEIEVELLVDSDTAQETAARISRALIEASARPSSLSKAAQALGSAAGDPPDVPDLPLPDPTAPSIDALQAIFASYLRDLLMADVGVRRDLPDSVHQMRVACRRLRSALKTFRPLLDSEAVEYLRGELQWLASELGEVRDTEVQRARLCGLSDDEETTTFIANTLDSRLRAATSSALAALRTDRHDFLLEDLVLLVREPPVTAGAFDPAGQRLPECVAVPWRRLAKSVRKASVNGPAHQWHEVRIRAKQARYSAEAVAPVLGSHFATLGKSLGKATDILGSRQDAHVSSLVLEELAAHAPGPIAYQLGLIAARNEVAGNEDIRVFHKRWPDIVHQAKEAGLD